MLTHLINLRGCAACRALLASLIHFNCASVYCITVGIKVPAIQSPPPMKLQSLSLSLHANPPLYILPRG